MKRLSLLAVLMMLSLGLPKGYTDVMFTQTLVPEASASVQDLYAQLFPVVQAVITDKNANVDQLLATANAAGQAKIDAGS